MTEALDELKARLSIETVVGRDYELKRSGRVLEAREHDSLKVDPARQRWRWYSKDLGGDALSWLALQRFGSTEVAGEDFIEVLREAADLAGMDFERDFAKGGVAAGRAAARRARQEVLATFARAAVKAWTPEKRALAHSRKPWLNEQIIERWGLGTAPTMGQMKAAGLNLEQLNDVGLIRAKRDRELLGWPAWFPFFRECIIIPYIERGRVVYLSSRRLIDIDPVTFEPKPAGKKALCLPAPRKLAGKWTGGMPQPPGFNLDILNSDEAQQHGVLLVEGPLDAIACTERGHPAVAMLRSSPSEDLVARLRRCLK